MFGGYTCASHGGSQTLSVIVPAYNEAKGILATVRDIDRVLDEEGILHEIIVVDDGSKDGTLAEASVAAGLSDSIRVYSYGQNNGKGYAIKHGFQFAKGEMVLFIDADSDLPPAQIPSLLAAMNGSRADVVIGSKRHPLSKVSYPLPRRVMSWMYGFLVRLLFGLRVADTQAGIKLFRREVLDRIFPNVLVKRYAFDIEVLGNAHRCGYKIVEVPVELNYRFASRISPVNIAGILLDTLAVFYRMRILHYYEKEPVG